MNRASRLLGVFSILLLTTPPELPAQGGKSSAPQLAEQLYRHAWSGNAAEVAKLLKAGADPNSVHRGMRPLHKAAVDGHVEVLRLLVDAGAEVNVKDSSGRSPLLEAAGSRNPKAVALLLAAGAKPDGSELGHACWLGRTEAVNLLLAAGAPPDAGLPWAAQSRHFELVKLLLDRGANVNFRTKDGDTPLHRAALQGGFKNVELLVQRGADLHAVDSEGNTPLHTAISGDCDLEAVKLLVKSGAMLNVVNHEGYTPVRLATFHGDKTAYKWLLAAAGGKEPIPERTPAERQRQAAKSTETLISEMLTTPLNEAGRQERLAAQWELLFRGKAVMPAILAAAESGIPIENFYELFRALGPEAEAALPMLQPLLDDPGRVQGGLYLMSIIKQVPIADLPLASRQKAAVTLNRSAWEGDRPEDFSGSLMSLVELGEMAVPYVIKLLQSENHYRRWVAVEALRSINYRNEAITAELIRLARHDPNHTVRKEAIGSLAVVGESAERVKAELMSIVKQSPVVRNNADPLDIQPEFQDRERRDTAAINLTRFGPSIIDELVPLLSQMDSPVRLSAIKALERLGEPAVPRMIELLDHKDPAIAISASVILTNIGKPSVPALYEVVAADNRSDSVRLAAAGAALRIDPAAGRQAPEILAAIPLLVRMLDRGTFQEQGRAAEAMRIIGPAAREALPLLRKRLELPAADVDTGRLVRDYVQREAQAAIAAIEAAPE